MEGKESGRKTLPVPRLLLGMLGLSFLSACRAAAAGADDVLVM